MLKVQWGRKRPTSKQHEERFLTEKAVEKVREDTLVSSHVLQVLTDSGIQIVCDIPYQCY